MKDISNGAAPSPQPTIAADGDTCGEQADPPSPVDAGLDGAEEGGLVVDNRARIVLQQYDRSLYDFYRWKQEGSLVVDPEWQRQYVWDKKRASRLIESLLIDIPVPVIYLGINDQGAYEVIDGLQRLTSVFDFFDNSLVLCDLEMMKRYNGLTFADIDKADQQKLRNKSLRTYELSPDTPKDLMFIIFERLNTGGIRLNDMEIRNCLFRGPLNDLIASLAQDADFRACVNQTNLERRMADRTLVLRYLSFYERTHHKAKQGLKRFITDFLKDHQYARNEKLDEYSKAFRKSMRASKTIFGDKGFRLRRDTAKGEWAPRPNATIFQIVATSFASYDLGQLTRKRDAIHEEYVDLIDSDPKWVDCVRFSTGDPAKIQYSFETWLRRLQEAVGDEAGNDPNRAFSSELKKQMFDQNPTCAICGQKITLLLDAALDHDIHYWRGGRTVPDNARLVHRWCNTTRPL